MGGYVINTRRKGQRKVLNCIKELTGKGWVVDTVEKTGRFILVKDLFGLWDVIAIKPNRTKLIQVKSNKKPVMADFYDFQARYPQFECEVWVYKDRELVPEVYGVFY